MRHIPELDGVRAFAVTLVMASHAGMSGKLPGGFGVTVFFFLSGFLITMLLRIEFDSTNTLNWRAFYLRRVLRIFPPLYMTLLLLTMLEPTGLFGYNASQNAVICDYTFLSNYCPIWAQGRGLPVPLWSLAVRRALSTYSFPHYS